MRYTWGDGPSRWTLVAAAVAAAALVVGVVDYQITSGGLPPYPESIRETPRRSDDLSDRMWLYAALVLVAVGAATVRALQRRPADDRRTIFANLGTAAVVLGVVYTILVAAANRHPGLEVHGQSGWTVVSLLLIVAAVGGTVVRLREPASAPPGAGTAVPHWHRWLGRVALGGLVLTVGTVLLAVVFSDYQPACGGAETETAPGWTDVLLWCALGTALGAGVLGMIGLVARHWFVALMCLVVNPVVLFFMIASTCAFY